MVVSPIVTVKESRICPTPDLPTTDRGESDDVGIAGVIKTFGPILPPGSVFLIERGDGKMTLAGFSHHVVEGGVIDLSL